MTRCPFAGATSRRRFLVGAGGAAGGLLAATGAAAQPSAAATPEAKGITPASPGPGRADTERFWGAHQAGILTPLQNHTYFAAFDVVTTKRAELIDMFRRWTAAAARMSTGQTAAPVSADLSKPAPDSLDALGLAPARLTLTFGIRPGVFDQRARTGSGWPGCVPRRWWTCPASMATR